jgi:DNA gyrase subunit A
VRDEGNERLGQRLVIVLRNDATPKIVLNNLYKHTQLQDSFGANMLALVDNVPRTLRLDEFVRHYITHQVEVIVRRTKYRLSEREKRAHILRGYLKALDALDAVIALIRASANSDEARAGLMKLLEVDELQANAILDMQLRRLAALERQKIIDEYETLMSEIKELTTILNDPAKQRTIIKEELKEIAEKYGDDRRTQIIAGDTDLSVEDLIPDQDVVVTITRGGYAKRTRADLYRSQRRGGKGVKGAALKQDDIVEHFFTASTHDWLLFFTNQGRVYRAKVHELPDAGRDARGQHFANLLAFKPNESIASVISISDYTTLPYLVIATKSGTIKKSPLTEYDSPRTGGLIAITLKNKDEVVAASALTNKDELLLISKKGMSLRFTADDETIRPMGRSASGVIGMKFRTNDELLSMATIRDERKGVELYVLTVTDGGYGKRTRLDEYRSQGRGGIGVKAAKVDENSRGGLIGALVVNSSDEILLITSSGVVMRTPTKGVRETGRDTMGVRVVDLDPEAVVSAIAKNLHN